MTKAEPATLADLNEPQREAVLHTEGPALILAGAGSGKTRALTHRIAYLMEQGVKPWQILAVTFTNKAANEMKSRIKNLLHIKEGQDVSPTGFHQGKLPVMGTFHSVCVRILRRDIEHIGGDKKFVIYDSDDQKKLMGQILKEMHIDEKELKAKAALGYVSRFKCEAVTPKQAATEATSAHMTRVVQAYEQYQKALAHSNALDFDDLLLETVRLFTECPEVLDRYQETWRYIHVDEYQDTNHVQYLLITLLAKKYRNVCVIGDPDQSIYAFRGADIRNILEFKKDYPEAKEIKLEQNYRSAHPILTASDAVIAPNPNRPEKSMWTKRSEGPKIVINELSDEKKEATEAVAAIQKLKQEAEVPLTQQAILYRTNAQSRLFEEACLRAGLPYRIVGGVKFYARREVKDVLAYLHLFLNPSDTISLLRVINTPSRKIGQTTLGKLQAFASQNNLTLWETLSAIEQVPGINEPTKERIAKFTTLIAEFSTRSTTEVVSEVSQLLISRIDLEGWLRDDPSGPASSRAGTEEGETRWGNVQELLTVMHKYDGLPPEQSLSSFLEEVALVSEVDNLDKGSDDAVTLMTLHLCKGLEFEAVYIAGCEEGIFPHANAMFDKSQLEEERRLMYVGMTRAKTHLQVLFARSRTLWGKTQANAASRFIDDLPPEVTEQRSDDVLSAFAWASQSAQTRINSGNLQTPTVDANLDPEFNQDLDFSDSFNQEADDLNPGTRVMHPSFGAGTVIGRRGDIIEVKFDNGEIKHLASNIAPLKII